MKKVIVFLLLLSAALFATDINGSFSTGVYWGTPFWNSDNIGQGKKIVTDDSTFVRSVNQLRLNGKFAEHFSVRFHALRSDGFQSDNRLSETKIYQVFAQYNFLRGFVRAGRFAPLNRWLRTTVDGGAVALAISDQIKINVMGGQSVRFGGWYDKEGRRRVIYGDVGYKSGKFGAKMKGYADEDVSKAGADFFGAIGKLRFNGNYGYDFTNRRLADGGLNLFLPLSSKWTLSGNYLLFRTEDWKLRFFEFDSYLIERLMAGLRYKVFSNYYLDFRQMVTMTSEKTGYISFLTVSGKYFTAGVNYLTGDSDLSRLGLTLGGHYTLFNHLELAGGVSPVDFQGPDEDDHELSVAYYLRASYKFLNSFALDANFNFYQENEALQNSARGGLQLRYNFGSK